ncbi:hypothetical protein [Sorangium sp. So ce145]|uniref:hypothetical protein n=1 Tax=Sorangium sp. So ce145 TaxID=3133285 RepID=UPI003F62BE75
MRERGNLLLRRNDYANAGRDYDEALALFRATGDVLGQAQVLMDRGAPRLREGVPVQAMRDYDEELALSPTADDRDGEGNALRARRFARAEEGDLGGAVCDYDLAMQLFLQLGDREPLKPRAGSRGVAADVDVAGPSEPPRAGRNHLRRAGIDRSELFETTAFRLNIRLHDTRATFITIKISTGRKET